MKRIIFIIFSFLIFNLFGSEKPSILFQKIVDFEYLKELHDEGFEVDYIEKKGDFKWDKIKNYNVIVIFSTPDGEAVSFRGDTPSKERIENFVSLIEKYLENGGGVLVFSGERNIKKQLVSDLLKNWGAKIPLERIVEKNEENISKMKNAPTTLIAYTDNIVKNELTKGVKGIWYPYSQTKKSQFTLPLYLDENWQVIVRASKTSETIPIDKNKERWKDFYDEIFWREEGVKEPPIIAVREYKKGRIGLIIQDPVFSILSGKKWFCASQILSEGVGDRKSDFGKLLLNIYSYLAEPSLKDKKVGGYTDEEERYLPPNYRSSVVKEYLSGGWKYEKSLVENPVSPKVNIFKGIIGVKTSYSGYKGNVEEYAKLGEKLGLSFIVFMEDFDKIDEDIFEKLKEDCKKFSNNKIKLFPGYTIRNNVGNYMIIYGPPEKIMLPPENLLTGPERKILYIQAENIKGEFTGFHHPPTFAWLLDIRKTCQIGYYNFNEVKNGMRITDLRLYSLAGIRYYRNNKLIEDITDEYLLSAQGTIPPTPVSINEVRSPEEMVKELELGHALTYVVTKSDLNKIYGAGLRYLSQYDAVNTFLSDGPIILSWPACHRPFVWGWGHYFPAEKTVMPSLISLISDKGLKEVKIYDGSRLYRRFILNGKKEFNCFLVLEGVIHRNLVLVAEDINGGKAVSFARRVWKDGTHGITFCSDHINDCQGGPGQMKLARGPFFPQINAPPIPWEVLGETWENGPKHSSPSSSSSGHGNNPNIPFLDCDKGKENGGRFEGPNVLDFADEGISAVIKYYNKVYSDRVLNVINPWHTFGDFKGEPELFTYILKYKEYLRPTIGPKYFGWPANAITVGTKSTIYNCEIIYKKDFKINSLKLEKITGKPRLFIYKKGQGKEVIDLKKKNYEKKRIVLNKGDWFGFFGEEFANPVLYRVIGDSIIYDLNNFEVYGNVEGKDVKKGEKFNFGIYSISFPVNASFVSEEAALNIISYLENTPDLEILRGKRIPEEVPCEFIPENYAIEIRIKKPSIDEIVYPCIINSLNPKWTAGIYQKKGYILKEYGTGENRFRPIYVDSDGRAYFPIYVALADLTHFIVGHPIIADDEGRDLIIQLTKVKENPPKWHLSVNNPTEKVIKTKLRKNIELPGLDFVECEIIVNPGEMKIIF